MPVRFHRKCSAPCVNRIEADEHRRLCEQLVGVMTGRLGRPYIAQLTRDMKEASAELEFEKAARLRDQIQMLETVVQQNAVVFDQDVDADVFGLRQRRARSLRARFLCARRLDSRRTQLERRTS